MTHSFSVNLLATTGDVTLSWTSPIYPKLYSNDSSINPLRRPITENEDAWIGSLLTLGAFMGPTIFSIIAENFGRKIALLAIGFPHIVSYVTLAFAQDVYLYYFARFLGGLAVGGGYCLLPMYIAEIAKKTDRGTLSQTLSVFWAIGNFIPYAIGPFISIKWFNSSLAIIPVIFFICFSLFGTETPYYYVKRNKVEKAEKSLMRLRSKGKEEVQEELQDIREYLKFNETGSLWEIIKNQATRKSFFVCLVLISSQELSGFCAISFHLQLIFEAAGTNIPADISALIVGAAIIVSSFVAPALIDRLGRRFLTIASCFGMCFAHILMGLYFYIHDFTEYNSKNISWIPMFSLIFYSFSFNFGICCVPWTLVSELFPSNAKHVATLCISSFSWAVSFIMTSYFNTMNDSLGRSGTFGFFATACFFTAIFSILLVPETKGKSFIEIQEMLNFGASKNLKINEHELMLQNSKLKQDIY